VWTVAGISECSFKYITNNLEQYAEWKQIRISSSLLIITFSIGEILHIFSNDVNFISNQSFIIYVVQPKLTFYEAKMCLKFKKEMSLQDLDLYCVGRIIIIIITTITIIIIIIIFTSDYVVCNSYWKCLLILHIFNEI